MRCGWVYLFVYCGGHEFIVRFLPLAFFNVCAVSVGLPREWSVRDGDPYRYY